MLPYPSWGNEWWLVRMWLAKALHQRALIDRASCGFAPLHHAYLHGTRGGVHSAQHSTAPATSTEAEHLKLQERLNLHMEHTTVKTAHFIAGIGSLRSTICGRGQWNLTGVATARFGRMRGLHMPVPPSATPTEVGKKLCVRKIDHHSWGGEKTLRSKKSSP